MSDQSRRRALAFNAVLPALKAHDQWLPLSVRQAVADAVLAAVDTEQRGYPDVQGRCPACGNTRLYLGDGGYVTCPRLDCPEPDAASTLLEENAGTTSVTIEPALPDLDVSKVGHFVPGCAEGRHVPAHPGETCDEADAFIAVRDQWISDVLAESYRTFWDGLVTGNGTGEPLGLLPAVPGQPDPPTPVVRALDILGPHLAAEPLYRKA
ncbi:DUF6085 family protein [[Kitasatospora] papulosa]|uniref:DUF6085 family protein n=1 Tax=[Kitasatospora] papulosa TaxID=1464011 RepID=UPI0036ABFD6C